MRDLSALSKMLLKFAPRGTKEITETTSLVKSGWVDSFALVEVVSFLEMEYGVRLPDADVVPENFENLAAIRALLDRAGS
ncbi:MAG: acyl carrier protein [Planctomycetes bacterium]|nr:acyl carrier protein [Planctomycetota bacterium]